MIRLAHALQQALWHCGAESQDPVSLPLHTPPSRPRTMCCCSAQVLRAHRGGEEVNYWWSMVDLFHCLRVQLGHPYLFSLQFVEERDSCSLPFQKPVYELLSGKLWPVVCIEMVSHQPPPPLHTWPLLLYHMWCTSSTLVKVTTQSFPMHPSYHLHSPPNTVFLTSVQVNWLLVLQQWCSFGVSCALA